ncbi:MAG: FtsQ-type POTRA domain-containing protein [Lachnospiraceae bacterium]|jgi:cell division protein FtsQ|nr:FtsQ-type POTRA domain-containing protein [Lachnospiraceae bacterium]MCI9282433.1 FtsQ-type POTRA domain-containing protein [Lachnospiraceae bacterium]
MRQIQNEKKRKLKIGAVIIVLLVGILFLSVRITQVDVTGNKQYTQEEIVGFLFPDNKSRNTLLCFLQDRLKKHIQIPFVEDYEIVFQAPNRVEVIVYEKSVVGYVSYMSSYMYFDKDGIIVESANEALPGVPLITGLKFGQIVLYQKLPLEKEEIFQEILNLTQILTINHLQVDRIQYGRYGEITLYMKGIEVLLGSGGNLNGKVAELKDMLPQLEGVSGILHLEDYDETNIRAGYTLEPK